ncbi:RHTO0S03e06370g2_1 [Rhodotorula toruloides]|uniref:RHTO0S03e06370g2_1 n=1 Tax=Rhodotorula toruloides TaxID=5286 RepID=A0A061AS69_RHOTO|nr:RHTO0S03e06370g2_1 [Rhodotorula toruloides]
MSAASPPPPPDPNRFNPFASTCGSSPSSSSRRPPLLRRSKTVANPESPLRWRREPLADVTNLVLGRRENWTGRLQRLERVRNVRAQLVLLGQDAQRLSNIALRWLSQSQAHVPSRI